MHNFDAKIAPFLCILTGARVIGRIRKNRGQEKVIEFVGKIGNDFQHATPGPLGRARVRRCAHVFIYTSGTNRKMKLKYLNIYLLLRVSSQFSNQKYFKFIYFWKMR